MEQLYNKTDTGYELKSEKDLSVALEIHRTIEFDYQDLESIFFEAFENTPISWGEIDTSTPEWKAKPDDMPDYAYVLQLLVNGEAVYLRGKEDRRMIWGLDIDKLYEAIKSYAEMVGDYTTGFFNDGDAASKILQIALFAGIDFE